ncbi:hypothetical protein B0H14DRAFT_3750876 [Mycena olivaceomarginata]|nr:hypothetical protein B0H14DRAFT_3750876 [Mycena olivaceomarginata]
MAWSRRFARGSVVSAHFGWCASMTGKRLQSRNTGPRTAQAVGRSRREWKGLEGGSLGGYAFESQGWNRGPVEALVQRFQAYLQASQLHAGGLSARFVRSGDSAVPDFAGLRTGRWIFHLFPLSDATPLSPTSSASHTQPQAADSRKRTPAACFKEIEPRIESEGVVHQILMVDELKVEGETSLDPATNATVASLGLMAKDPTLYGARTGLISGSCKQESGERHSKILKTALDASAVTKLRTTCIYSDGEARRAEAMIRLTFKFSLAPSSPIYPLLHGLEFLNLMVGEDDLTGDKDYKHCFKRLRNWLLRKRGLVIGDLEITMAVIRSQLQFHGLAPVRIGNLLQPNDRQDVKLAYDLLRERSTSSLSSAAHLLLALMRKTNAGAKFMPTQLYIDLMLMNQERILLRCENPSRLSRGRILVDIAWDRPAWRCYLEFCEQWFGSDANVDLLQLALRITGTTELPVLSGNDIEIEQKQDHITPSSWTGDVAVKNVNLRTAWIMGRKDIEGEFPALASVLKELSDKRASGEKIDILQPFGKDIVHAERAADDVDDSAEDYQEAGADPSTCNSDPPPEPFTEDAVAEDDPEQNHSPTFTLGGKEVYKGRYMIQTDTTYSSVIRSDEDPTGTQITLDIPIVTFVECEDKFFVCIGELLHIHPALQEADETGKNDWIWEKGRGKTFTTPGRFTELIDPDINVAKGQSARLLFDSQDILAIGAMIFGRITAADGPKIASIPRSATSRIRTLTWDQANSAFFVKTKQLNTRLPELGVAHIAHRRSNLVREFRTFSTTIQLTSSSTPQSKRRISPVVSAFAQLPNARSFSKVDGRKSNCPGYSRFSYQTASVSETKNPSSNVPVLCPTSSCSAVIWKYVLHRHFKECHPGLPQSVYDAHAISATEKRLLKVLWNNRHTKTQRKSKKSKQKKGIERDASERYKTSWALRINDDGVDKSGTDEVVEAVLVGETSCDARGNSAGALKRIEIGRFQLNQTKTSKLVVVFGGSRGRKPRMRIWIKAIPIPNQNSVSFKSPQFLSNRWRRCLYPYTRHTPLVISQKAGHPLAIALGNRLCSLTTLLTFPTHCTSPGRYASPTRPLRVLFHPGECRLALPDLPESDDQEDLPLHLASPKSTTSSFTAENNEDIIMEEAILPSTMSDIQPDTQPAADPTPPSPSLVHTRGGRRVKKRNL